MSASSTSNLTPPIPCQGVEFGYTTPILPTLNPNSLGYTYTDNTLLSATIPASSTTVLNLIPDVPAGTYNITCLTTVSATVADVQISIQLRIPNTSTLITNSAAAYFTAGTGNYESQSNTGVYTSTVPFDAVCVGITDATGSANAAASFLQLVRIA